MELNVIPELIDQYREVFEGQVDGHQPWLTEGRKEDGVFATLDSLTAVQALAAPAPGARSAAEHVKHLQYSLDWLHQRMQGQNPEVDWKSSFDLPAGTPAVWKSLKHDLRTAYSQVLAVFQQQRQTSVSEMPSIHLISLSATVSHCAYHLAAIRQLAVVARHRA